VGSWSLNIFEDSVSGNEEVTMSQTDWAKIYAEMDKRIIVKYEQLPNGEQLGKRPQAGNQQIKSS
jgi:hypothetical protein